MAQQFVILAWPRTGSSHLVNCLNSRDEVRCHYELYNADHVGFFDGPDKETVPNRDADPLGFLERTLSITGPSACGFKIFPGQSEEVLEYCLERKNILKILLYRENPLAVFSSDMIAQDNQIWTRTTESELITEESEDPAQRSQIEFLADKFEEYLEKYYKFYSDITNKLVYSGQEFLMIRYSDLKNEKLLRRIFVFLSVSQPGRIYTSMKRINSSTIIDRFSNLPDVIEYLKTRGRLAWQYECLDSWQIFKVKEGTNE